MVDKILDFSYLITLYDAFGNKLKTLGEYEQFEYTLKENDVCEMEISLPSNKYDFSIFDVDRIIEIERTIGSKTYIDGERYWRIRKWRRQDGRRGEGRIIINCECENSLLAARFVNYVSGSSEASKSFTYGDNMMKEIVDENLGTSAASGSFVFTQGRDVSDVLSIQANTSQSGAVEKSFAWRNVLLVLQEISETLKQRSVNFVGYFPENYLVFDCVRLSPGKSEFRTYIGQRGVDHGSNSDDKAVVSKERGNLVNASLTYDYQDIANYVRAGGSGQGANRVLVEAITDSIDYTPVSRREKFADARNGDTVGDVNYEAWYEAQEKRPRVIVGGKIVDTSGFRYGIHYNWGDIVIADVFGISVDCHIDTVNVKVSGGKEEINTRVRGEVLIGRIAGTI